MRVLYYEPLSGGHRADYVASVVRHLRTQPDTAELVIAAPDALRAELPEDVSADLCAIGTVSTWLEIDAADTRISAGAQLAHAAGLARDNMCTALFFPLIDDVLPHLALATGLDDLRISGVYFRPSMHYKHYRDLRDWLLGRMKGLVLRLALRRRHVQTILSLDRDLPAYAARHFRHADKLVYLPDMAPCAGITPPETSPRGARTRFVLFGALQRRKGVLQTLDAIARLAPETAARLELRLCGRLVEDAEAVRARIKALNAASRAQIALDDRYLPFADLCAEVAAADIVLAPYLWHKGSSGVLYWAAAFHKPVIAQDYGAMGEEVRRFGLGLTIRSGDVGDLAGAMTMALSDEGVPAPDAAMLARFAHGHDPLTFAQTIIANL